MTRNHAFFLMVQEKWWTRFCQRLQNGENIHSFVLKGVAPPKYAEVILFYVTSPVRKMAGHAECIERVVGKPDELWNKHGSESVLRSRDEFEEFVGTAQEVSFVRFRNLRVSANPVELSRLLLFFGVRRLSRKGFYVDKEAADMLISMME